MLDGVGEEVGESGRLRRRPAGGILLELFDDLRVLDG
jgi:hypothetical protein